MESKKFEDLSKVDQIIATLYARQNYINGKYRHGNLELDNLFNIKDNNMFYIETIKMKADLFDKMISEAELQGKDTTDPKIMKELGEKINTSVTPINKKEAVMTSIFNSLGLIVYYGISIGIWGLVFNGDFFTFGFYGAIIGLLLSLVFFSKVASKRTKEAIRIESDVFGMMFGQTGIYIGVIGLIVLVIKLIFF